MNRAELARKEQSYRDLASQCLAAASAEASKRERASVARGYAERALAALNEADRLEDAQDAAIDEDE